MISMKSIRFLIEKTQDILLYRYNKCPVCYRKKGEKLPLQEAYYIAGFFAYITGSGERIYLMTQIENTLDTLSAEDWQDSTAETAPAYGNPVVHASRLAHFFHALAASMLWPKRQRVLSERRPIMYPTDILAQNYPHLYFRVMCG